MALTFSVKISQSNSCVHVRYEEQISVHRAEGKSINKSRGNKYFLAVGLKFQSYAAVDRQSDNICIAIPCSELTALRGKNQM